MNLDRVVTVLDSPPAALDVGRGYLDLLEDDETGSTSLGQRLMTSRLLPFVYERAWRPVGVRLLTGLTSPTGSLEREFSEEFLVLGPGARVLDLACGPGNITRRLAARVGAQGLVVGVDASPTMLSQAVRETRDPKVGYVRADAQALPFRDGSFDAVCCYAALYLMDEPFQAIGQIARVLAPGGRTVILTSCQRGPGPLAPLLGVPSALAGVRMFGRQEVAEALAAEGLGEIRQRVAGFAQFLAAQKPAG